MKESKGFNAATGTSSEGFSRGTNRFAGNQHATTNSDALINKGRGPTVGNKSDKDSTYPKADAMPMTKPGKDMVMGCHNPQVRTPGGTKAMPKLGQESFEFGRGPTKGNA